MAPMRLPLELIQLIIAHTPDLITLRAWALVSWACHNHAERRLWHTLVLHPDHFDNDWPAADTPADVLCTLKREATWAEYPDAWRRWSAGEAPPPVVLRAHFVKALSLRARLNLNCETHEAEVDQGVVDGFVISTFEWLSLVLVNLASVRLDGSFGQRAWNALMLLPALKELRLWRTRSCEAAEIWDFRGLERLRAFEIGSLYLGEAGALGREVRECVGLEVLAMAVREDESYWEPNVFLPFFEELVGVSDDDSDVSGGSEDECYGFPPSLVELAIEDEDNDDICSPEILQKAFRRCSRLTSLYLDIKDAVLIGRFSRELHLPRLEHLYLPLVTDISRGYCSETMTEAMAKLAERHRETLTFFRVLNLMDDDAPVEDLSLKLKKWLTVQELRFDGGDIDDLESEERLQWPSLDKYISIDGSDSQLWGGDLRRVRFDKFDITDIQNIRIYHPDWERVKILILNPLLPWHYGLFPDPNESTSVLAQDLKCRHLLGPAAGSRQGELCERMIVQKIINMEMPKPAMRVVSINEFRFWIEPRSQRIWHLRDALEDKEQSLIVNRSLDAEDWGFLSERTAASSVRGANSATFMRPDSASPPPHGIRLKQEAAYRDYCRRYDLSFCTEPIDQLNDTLDP